MNRLCIGLILTSLLAGCSTTGGLGAAANRLDSTAHQFYERLDSQPVAGHTATDAALLAEAARDFNRAVDHYSSRDNLRPTFDRVAERYHHLRRQLDDKDYYYRYQRAGFEGVTEAYLDVDRAMNHMDSRYHD
jgi:hypothetical protein